MAKVTISQAAKLAGIARQNLYKNYINTGKISVITDQGAKYIDTAEILRVFGKLEEFKEGDTRSDDMIDIKVTENDTGQKEGDRDNIIENYKTLLSEKDKLIQHLQNELHLAHDRERWLREQIPKQIEHKKTGLFGWIKDML